MATDFPMLKVVVGSPEEFIQAIDHVCNYRLYRKGNLSVQIPISKLEIPTSYNGYCKHIKKFVLLFKEFSTMQVASGSYSLTKELLTDDFVADLAAVFYYYKPKAIAKTMFRRGRDKTLALGQCGYIHIDSDSSAQALIKYKEAINYLVQNQFLTLGE